MTERRILVIEDEKKIADTLKAGLEENGYEVVVAYDGNMGYRLTEGNQFSVIVVDINLPGMNGYDVTRAVRAKDTRIPIIMITALNTLNDKIEGYDSGADDFIIKPFHFKELLMKVRVLLKRTMEQTLPTGTILSTGELSMNLDTKEVRRNDKVITLTAKEFQLLEYLMRNKNRVVSRSDIAVNVWEIDFDTNTNVIDVYINYLRNKVDKPFESKMIHTHVGMGYMLKES